MYALAPLRPPSSQPEVMETTSVFSNSIPLSSRYLEIAIAVTAPVRLSLAPVTGRRKFVKKRTKINSILTEQIDHDS